MAVVMAFSVTPLSVFAAGEACEHPSLTEENKCVLCGAEIKARLVKSGEIFGEYFETFEEALSLAQTAEYKNSTITLLADYEGGFEVTEGAVSIDADGFSVTGEKITVRNAAILSILGGDFTTSIYAYEESRLGISGGTFTPAEGGTGISVSAHNNATIAVSGGTFNGTVETFDSSYSVFRSSVHNGNIESHAQEDMFFLNNISSYGKVIVNGKGHDIVITSGNYHGEIEISNGASFKSNPDGYPLFDSTCSVNIYDENNDGTDVRLYTGIYKGPVNVFGGTLTVDDWAKMTLLNVFEKGKVSLGAGTYEKIVCEGDMKCFELLERRHIFKSTADNSLTLGKDVSTLENVKVEDCPDHVYDENHICTVCLSSAEALVISANGEVTEYDLIKDAFSYAQTLSGVSTVKLLDEAYLENSIHVFSGDEIILDLNGNSIYDVPDSGGSRQGILTLKKLTVIGNGTARIYFGAMAMEDLSGEIVIENGTFDSYFALMGKSKLTVSDGTFNGYVYLVGNDSGEPEIELNGGSYKMLFTNEEEYNWYSALGEGKGFETDSDKMFGSFKFRDVDVIGFDGNADDTMLKVVDHTKHNADENGICKNCGAVVPIDPTEPSDTTDPTDPSNPSDVTDPTDPSDSENMSIFDILRDFFNKLFKLIREIISFFKR